MASFRFVLVDVFTDRPLAGNQLAVFTDARELPEETLQPLARELNLSETAFVYPPAGDGHVRLRIFTPTAELAFAGHPVLGAAFVLGGPLQLTEIRLETGVGVIPVELEREGARIVFGRMAQPIPHIEALGHAEELLRALGIDTPELPVELYDVGSLHALVGIGSDEALRALTPNDSALRGLPLTCAVCFAGSGRRWRVRSFCAPVGISEDPATGSAAGPLACHLARHGLLGFGEEIEISQGAEIGRPSTIYARADGSGERIEKVEVGGSAVVVARGEFRLG